MRPILRLTPSFSIQQSVNLPNQPLLTLFHALLFLLCSLSYTGISSIFIFYYYILYIIFFKSQEKNAKKMQKNILRKNISLNSPAEK